MFNKFTKMENFVELKENYNHIESPYDLIYLCYIKSAHNKSLHVDRNLCLINHVLGIFSGYIFPFIGTFGLVGNATIFYIFIFKYSKITRQTVFLTFLAVSDFTNIFSFGWLWIFPAKGLPYMSRGKIYFFISNISDVACKSFRSFITFSSTWAIGAFLMICIDRMLAILFPMQLIKYGYKSAITSSVIMVFLCLLFASPVLVHSKFVKIDFKMLCNPFGDDNLNIIKFIKIWYLLFVYGGAVPVLLILLFNTLLLWKVKDYRKKLKKLAESSNSMSRKELKATILVLILTVFFLIGSIIKILVDVLYINFQNISRLEINSIEKYNIEDFYNIWDISSIITLFMESMNVLIYYAKIKRFRIECNKILCINL